MPVVNAGFGPFTCRPPRVAARGGWFGFRPSTYCWKMVTTGVVSVVLMRTTLFDEMM
jgi:hypothetical protein